MDVLAALLPPAFMAGVVIAFVVWLYRSQLAKREDGDGESEAESDDNPDDNPDDTNE